MKNKIFSYILRHYGIWIVYLKGIDKIYQLVRKYQVCSRLESNMKQIGHLPKIITVAMDFNFIK